LISGITTKDILDCSDKFWELCAEPLLAADLGAFTILNCHVNLAIGVLVRYLPVRPDLAPLVQDLLDFKVIGLYLLSERGHGMDAFNIETTATKVTTGFILNSPGEQAMK
jgi:acyl-CoA oxidase